MILIGMSLDFFQGLDPSFSIRPSWQPTESQPSALHFIWFISLTQQKPFFAESYRPLLLHHENFFFKSVFFLRFFELGLCKEKVSRPSAIVFSLIVDFEVFGDYRARRSGFINALISGSFVVSFEHICVSIYVFFLGFVLILFVFGLSKK